jgi:hypothetical protein
MAPCFGFCLSCHKTRSLNIIAQFISSILLARLFQSSSTIYKRDNDRGKLTDLLSPTNRLPEQHPDADSQSKQKAVFVNPEAASEAMRSAAEMRPWAAPARGPERISRKKVHLV